MHKKCASGLGTAAARYGANDFLNFRGLTLNDDQGAVIGWVESFCSIGSRSGGSSALISTSDHDETCRAVPDHAKQQWRLKAWRAHVREIRDRCQLLGAGMRDQIADSQSWYRSLATRPSRPGTRVPPWALLRHAHKYVHRLRLAALRPLSGTLNKQGSYFKSL